jgi:hypothetical protein
LSKRSIESSAQDAPTRFADERDHQQQMDQSGPDVECETQCPQDHQNYDDCPKHLVSPTGIRGMPRRDLFFSLSDA